jgi:hypothetical protein
LRFFSRSLNSGGARNRRSLIGFGHRRRLNGDALMLRSVLIGGMDELAFKIVRMQGAKGVCSEAGLYGKCCDYRPSGVSDARSANTHCGDYIPTPAIRYLEMRAGTYDPFRRNTGPAACGAFF